MEVIIDQQERFEFKEPPANVLEAVAEVSEALRARGRAVLAVQLDGRRITPDRGLTVLEAKRPDEVNKLEITSEPLAALVSNCLKELEQVLPDLPQACHRLAEVFHGEHPESGYEPFQRLAEIWKTIKEREIQVMNALNVHVEDLLVNGVPLGHLHEDLNQYIDEAAEALQSSDCVLLGDLLEYELAPRADLEAEIVALLRARADALRS